MLDTPRNPVLTRAGTETRSFREGWKNQDPVDREKCRLEALPDTLLVDLLSSDVSLGTPRDHFQQEMAPQHGGFRIFGDLERHFSNPQTPLVKTRTIPLQKWSSAHLPSCFTIPIPLMNHLSRNRIDDSAKNMEKSWTSSRISKNSRKSSKISKIAKTNLPTNGLPRKSVRWQNSRTIPPQKWSSAHLPSCSKIPRPLMNHLSPLISSDLERWFMRGLGIRRSPRAKSEKSWSSREIIMHCKWGQDDFWGGIVLEFCHQTSKAVPLPPFSRRSGGQSNTSCCSWTLPRWYAAICFRNDFSYRGCGGTLCTVRIRCFRDKDWRFGIWKSEKSWSSGK